VYFVFAHFISYLDFFFTWKNDWKYISVSKININYIKINKYQTIKNSIIFMKFYIKYESQKFDWTNDIFLIN